MSLRIKIGMRLVYCGNSDHMQGVKGIVINKVGYGRSLFLRSDCKSIYPLPRQTGVWEEEEVEAGVRASKPAVGQVWRGKVTGRLKTIEIVGGDSVKFSVGITGDRVLSEALFLANHTFVSEAPKKEVEQALPAFVRNAVAEQCPDGKFRYFLPVTHFNASEMGKLLENRYVKFVATGIKRVANTTSHTHKAVLDDGTGCYYGHMEEEGGGYCSIGFHKIPKVWPLEYAGEGSKRKKPTDKPAIDKRKFILWNPKHPAAPSVILEGKARATAVAHKMAASNQDATFYICELVAVTKTTKVTTRTVSVEEL